MLWRKEKSCTAGNRTRVVQPVAIPTELSTKLNAIQKTMKIAGLGAMFYSLARCHSAPAPNNCHGVCGVGPVPVGLRRKSTSELVNPINLAENLCHHSRTDTLRDVRSVLDCADTSVSKQPLLQRGMNYTRSVKQAMVPQEKYHHCLTLENPMVNPLKTEFLLHNI
jgi:hypothetical protein